MEPFSESSICPKCHHTEAETEYHGPLPHLAITVAGEVECIEDRPEWLERTCTRCRYQWREAVLDSPAV